MKLEEFKSAVKDAMFLIEDGFTRLKDAVQHAESRIEDQDDKEEAGLFILLQAAKIEKIIEKFF